MTTQPTGEGYNPMEHAARETNAPRSITTIGELSDPVRQYKDRLKKKFDDHLAQAKRDMKKRGMTAVDDESDVMFPLDLIKTFINEP